MKAIADISIFVNVAREGAMSRAGRKLGLSPASISKRLTRFEQELGVRLLNRTPRAARLTEEGRELFEKLGGLLEEIDEATASISSRCLNATGTLHLATSSSLGYRHVSPLVSDFAGHHPELSVRLHLRDDCVDLIRDGYDAAIMTRQPRNTNLIARPLHSSRCVLCASPGYLRDNPPPRTPGDLTDHRCLIRDSEESFSDRWPFLQNGRQRVVRVSAKLAANSSEVIREWALAGQGIALMSEWEVQQELDDGRLVCLLEDFALPGIEFYIVYTGRCNQPARTRKFVEYMISRLAQQPAA